MDDKLILIVNPGSSSRKYALYNRDKVIAELHFETEDKAIICHAKTDESEDILSDRVNELAETPATIEPILREIGALAKGQNIDAIAVRTVAPGDYFAQNLLVDDQVIKRLEDVQNKAPLHVSVLLAEMKALKAHFSLPIYAISDTAVHANKPLKAQFYAIDTKFATEHQIKRFGYHGLSVGSVAHIMNQNKLAQGKTIVCHLGSGCSVSALKNGVSVDNSMGYSPLEGVAMATRSGNIDFSAAVAIKNALNLSLEETETYLNKKSGLLGLSGISDDLRDIIAAAEDDDERAKATLEIYVYKIQQEIGKMAAALNGIDSIVFTATIGERSSYLRERVMSNLEYLGVELDKVKNEEGFTGSRFRDISSDNSKPVYIIKTDESAEMIRRVLELI